MLIFKGMQFHAQLADAMQAPTEFRLLNNSGPITVGRPEDREKKGLSTFLNVSVIAVNESIRQ